MDWFLNIKILRKFMAAFKEKINLHENVETKD